MNDKEYEIIFNSGTNFEEIKAITNIIKVHCNVLEIKICYAFLSAHDKAWLTSLKCIKQVNETTYLSAKTLYKQQNNSSLDISEEQLDIRKRQWDIIELTNNRKSYSLHSISTKIKIGIIDSGIQTTHIDLKESILGNSKNFVPKGGFNNLEPNENGDIKNFEDILGHGTSVAGQITANGTLQGIAPGIGINVYRVFGMKSAKTSWIIQAIIQAVDDGNQVINLSVGNYLLKNGSYVDGSNDYNGFLVYKRAIDYATSKGSIIVSTLGNDSLDLTSDNGTNKIIEKKNLKKIEDPGGIVDSPSNFDHVIKSYSVNKNFQLSSYSNWGYNNLAIATYGGDEDSLFSMGYNKFTRKKIYEHEWILSTHLEDSYNFFYGNSMATPKVAATLALIIDKFNLYNFPSLAIKHLFNTAKFKDDKYILNTFDSLYKKLSS